MGIHLSAVGHTKISAHAQYPPHAHPTERAFTWSRGRVLPTLQVIAIRSGRGVVEWTRESVRLGAGSIFVLRPGEWHRYRPDPGHGWTEDWFELKGQWIDEWHQRDLIRERVFEAADPNAMFRRFDRLHRSCLDNSEAIPGDLLGQAISILSVTLAAKRRQSASKANQRKRAQIALARERMQAGESVAEIATALGLSYPSLYRLFKSTTGLSPKAYAEQIRMARAETQLSQGELSVKEIAAHLGYYSANHFSEAFRKAYGCAPSQWRRRQNRKA